MISKRPGHASVAFTLQTYSHVIPGIDKDAAATVADLILRRGFAPLDTAEEFVDEATEAVEMALAEMLRGATAGVGCAG